MLFVENCGIDDDRMSEILIGVKNQIYLSSLTIKKTNIGLKSLIILNEILS